MSGPHTTCERDRAKLREALIELRVTARLLFESAKGCAAFHHGVDHELNGLPGWLGDCEKSIIAAEAALSR